MSDVSLAALAADFPSSSLELDGVFIDWVVIRQPNDGRYPLLNGGRVVKLDADGAVVFDSALSIEVEGSFETSAKLRVTDAFLELSFNPSRWERPENLFGYRLEDCVLIADRVLGRFDMPPLIRDGVSQVFSNPRKRFELAVSDPRFYFVRVDVTMNVCCGSRAKLEAYLRHLRRQTMPRRRTVSWPGSVLFRQKSSSLSVYDKAREIRDHGVTPDRERVASWCEQQGVARLELRLQERALQRLGLKRGASHSDFVGVFAKEVSALSLDSLESDYDGLTDAELGVLLMWQQGFDVRERLTVPTFYRRRKAIKDKTGFDIGGESPVRLVPKEVKFSVKAAEMPDWYELPPVKEV